MDGIIFHIHGDRNAAISDISTSAAIIGTGKDLKFELLDAHRAQLQLTSRPSNLPDNSTATQLDGTAQGALVCHQNGNLGDHGDTSLVKSALSANPLPTWLKFD